MDNSFIRKSNLTHKDYDYFKCVKIKNILQATKYIDFGVFPLDIRVERMDDKKILVFYFDKEGSREAFDLWCKYEL